MAPYKMVYPSEESIKYLTRVTVKSGGEKKKCVTTLNVPMFVYTLYVRIVWGLTVYRVCVIVCILCMCAFAQGLWVCVGWV